MAIKYKLYQDNRAESKNRGKWYARAIYPKTPKNTKDLAQMIQDNVSVKRADVIAVLDELVNVMKLWLQESYRVSLDGLGSFKIGLKTACRHREGLLSREARRGLPRELPARDSLECRRRQPPPQGVPRGPLR